MPEIQEIKSMFWGVTLDGGKRYTQTVEHSFHISHASLEPAPKDGSHRPVTVCISHNKAEFVLAVLQSGKIYNQTLDLNFTEGEEVTFFLGGEGKGVVHLTGYLVEDDVEGPDFDDMELSEADMTGSDEESSEDDAEISRAKSIEKLKSQKRKKDEDNKSGGKKRKVIVQEEDDSDDDSEDEDYELDEAVEESESDDEDADDDDDDDEDAGEEEEEEEDEGDSDEEGEDDDFLKSVNDLEDSDSSETDMTASYLQPDAKKKKGGTPTKREKAPAQKVDTQIKKENTKKSSNKIKPEPASPPVETPATESSKKKKRKKKNKNKDQDQSMSSQGDDKKGANVSTQKSADKQQTNAQSASKPAKPKKTVLKGGLMVEDLKEGHGPEARHSKMVGVYYRGCLKNGRQFDATLQGKPFKFRLGQQEVIRGWDAGVAGMKVGGKRKLTIPAPLGYGAKGAPPDIPPNSTLVFELELKSVN